MDTLGNGESTIPWHEIWSEGMLNSTKGDDLIVNGQLKLPEDWIQQYPQVLSNVKNISLNPNKNDSVQWLSNNRNQVKFSVNRVWKDLRNQEDAVLWSNVVRFSTLVPRQVFILWLLICERLPTQDRILKWYPNKVMKCAL
ncbi:RNA-directed DNA polymerase, eukaryota, Reverse transcriptase zinc-binding domain protein [Artemisia annua]|uniref:RNA-directed DNA polymerase, eukaryota, Reverse transcriptase zinc-binding domain protein n=1 Tax=Artemisia annua TaxID=35608 RepID=A0A2U1KN52_ARTAN|nr:RNA-directed DNA polymerase, eukaryota, Reverse transcriptase zinc-binding domain protein [Artemisia annua]